MIQTISRSSTKKWEWRSKEMGMEVYWIWIHSGASEMGISYAWILA